MAVRCVRCGQFPRAAIDLSKDSITGRIFCGCTEAAFDESKGGSFNGAVANWEIKIARYEAEEKKEAQSCKCTCGNTLYGRPCVILDGRHGMFHGWAKLHDPEATRGIVEMKNGELVYVKPEKIQFFDGGIYDSVSWPPLL